MRTWIIVAVVIVVVVIGAVVLAMLPDPNEGDSSKLDVTFSAEEQRTIDTVTISRAELAAANCKDGAACQLAVNGVVYDMSGFPTWMKRGHHHGVEAGTDATEAFVKSGHARAHLEKMPVVGRLG